MVDISVECLQGEIRVLEPVLILRTHLAKAAMEQIRDQYPSSVSDTFDQIEEHPGLVEVVHWSSNSDSSWRLRIQERLTKDADLAARVESTFNLSH
jgi:hypothetical protein